MKTAQQVCEELNIKRSRLSQLTNGNTVRRNGKVEYTEPALLSEGTDYVRSKSGLMFTESAIEKIKNKLKK